MKNFPKSSLIINTLFLVFALQDINAQVNSKEQQDPKIETQRLMDLYRKLEGTYQIQIIDSREKSELQLNILDTVEEMRHKTDTVYFWMRANKRLMILPFSVIEKKDFKGIENISHISLIGKN